jgi:hypothetical protein
MKKSVLHFTPNQGLGATKQATREHGASRNFLQLSLWETPPPIEDIPFKKRIMPQISSIAGLPPTQPNRYRVKLGDAILGEYLPINEALSLANDGGER